MTTSPPSPSLSPAEGQAQPYVVLGATGQQGGATAHALLDAGAPVRALIRDTAAPTAQALARRGADLVSVNWQDAQALRAAFTDAAGVFIMTTPAGPDGPAGEVRHGLVVADAAAAADVPHLVYSSVGGAERHTGIPHFESKRRVEEHLSGLGLPVTFLRPVFFMDNFRTYFSPVEEDGKLVLRLPLTPGVPLQMIAVRDIGAIAATVLQDPTSVPGGAIEIAGDELTGEQIATVYGQQTGKPASFQALPLNVLSGDRDSQAMFEWFSHLPAYQGDITATRRLAPDILDLANWLRLP